MRPKIHTTLLLLLLLLFLPTRTAYAINNVVFIVDGSGSMDQSFEGRRKLDTVKEALRELVGKLPESGTNAGLVVYSGGCNSSRAIVPLAILDRQALQSNIAGIQAQGKTPIALSLELAAEQLKDVNGDKAIILLTDGEETCSGEPLQVAERLRRQNIAIYVVGFDIPGVDAARELQRLARVGNGAYFTATTADGLRDAVVRAAEAAEKGEEVAYMKVQENIQIIVDTSASMDAEYERSTRLGLARAALKKVLELQHPDRDNLAFRHFGGRCGAFSSELVVPFGLNNGPPITQSIEGLKPKGERTFVDAILSAIDDFNDPERFEGVSRRVIVLIGGTDACQRPQAAQIIRERLSDANIKPSFKFIGIGIRESDAAEIRELAQAAGDGRPLFVLDQEALDRTLLEIFEFEPAIENVNAIVDVLNASTNNLNGAVNLMQQDDFAGARAKIREAERLRNSTLTPYEDLARRRINDDFKRVFEFSQSLRERQGQLVKLQLDAINNYESYKRSLENYNESIDRIKNVSDAYERLVNEANTVLRRLQP